MDIAYTIRFYSEWHCGSGLAAGADLDALVVKDADGLPFVPGKTIKGLVREAVEYIPWADKADISKEQQLQLLADAFGNSDTKSYDFLYTPDVGKVSKQRKGTMFFTNAELDKQLQTNIRQDNLQSYLYRSIASTAIEDGIAKEHSLRRMEVVVPCELHGEIKDVPGELVSIIDKALRYIKRLGQNRNKGLGRCDFIINGEEK